MSDTFYFLTLIILIKILEIKNRSKDIVSFCRYNFMFCSWLWFRKNELRGKSHCEKHTREVLHFTGRWHQFSVQHGGEVEVQRKRWPEREPCLLWSTCKEVQRDNGSVSFPVNESLTDEKETVLYFSAITEAQKKQKDKWEFPLSILSIFEHH